MTANDESENLNIKQQTFYQDKMNMNKSVRVLQEEENHSKSD